MKLQNCSSSFQLASLSRQKGQSLHWIMQMVKKGSNAYFILSYIEKQTSCSQSHRKTVCFCKLQVGHTLFTEILQTQRQSTAPMFKAIPFSQYFLPFSFCILRVNVIFSILRIEFTMFMRSLVVVVGGWVFFWSWTFRRHVSLLSRSSGICPRYRNAKEKLSVMSRVSVINCSTSFQKSLM